MKMMTGIPLPFGPRAETTHETLRAVQRPTTVKPTGLNPAETLKP